MKSPASRQRAAVLTPGVVISLLLSAFFFWVWYERYLRIEFNELGRYYDPQAQIVYTDAAFVWCLPAFGFLLFAIVRIAYRIWIREA